MANDYFRFQRFTVWQQHCAMKVGTDGTLLGAWAPVPLSGERTGMSPTNTGMNPTSTGMSPLRILDVGTGTGLIALMMAQRWPQAQVVAIDIDPAAVQQAQANVAASPFAARISVRLQDVADTRGRYDAIVSNPPFFTASLHSPDAQRTMARHDDTLTYRKLMASADRLLADDGVLSVVVPTDQQGRMESEAALAGLLKWRECRVRTSARKEPKRCLLAFARHARQPQRDELTIGSDEYQRLTKDFYL